MAYDAPTPAELKLRYPAFADVDDVTVQYWLTDAERYVDTSWLERDYKPALMAAAAHFLTIAGYGAADTTATPSLPAGVTSVRSADFAMTITSEQANSQAEGGWLSTKYGAEFKRMQRINRGGPRVAPTGTLPYNPALYPMGET